MEGSPFGRYRLIELIGRGGMGEVWRAHDTAIDRVVALKVLPANFAGDEVYQERFRREAHAAAGLDEPHVVPIHDFGEIDGRLYVTMRLIKGRDLGSILAEGPLEPARAIRIIDQIASALHAAHRIGLVHRDIKPSNILVAEDDFAYLIDFGIAHAAGETGLTSAGSVIGSWAYMAPERLTTGQADARADIYALACVLFECLTGSQPFPGTSLEQQIAGHLTLPPPRPSTMHASVPAELDIVVAKGMAKNPDERYSTTKEMATAARAAITAPMTRPQWMPPTQPMRPTERRAELPSWPAAPQSHQELATGGVSPSAPTQYRPATGPHLQVPPPQSARQPLPKKPRKGLRIALASVGVAVVVIVAVVVAISLTSSGDRGKPPPGNTPSTALPNTGPFTGTYTADFGPVEDLSGKPVEGATGETQRWDIRSVCRSTGCVATVTARSGPTLQSKFVFDDVGGQWIAVDAALVTLPRFKDCRFPADYWEVVTLHPRPDGSLSGDYTIGSNDCYIHRAVTFTRSGDVDISALPDPATEPPRVTSPAEALHGRYHNELIYSDGTKYEDDFGVRTDCLRTGDRCMSIFLNPKYFKPLVFGNGKWTLTAEFDSPCSAGGTSHVKDTSEFPLPQPPQDPITLLTGHGHVEVKGSACTGADYDDKFVRTGD